MPFGDSDSGSEYGQELAEARKGENYYIWFKNMEDLHTIIRHKFSEKEDEEEYIKKIGEIIKIANENREVWLGKNKDAFAVMKVESALRDVEMFLYQKMDDAKMFGQIGYNAEL
jgi:hypothetical protein